MNFINSFIDNIKDFMMEKNLNFIDLEKLTNVSHNNISLYLTGKATPTVNTTLKFSKALQYSCDYLMGFSEKNDLSYINNVENVELFISRLLQLIEQRKISKYELSKIIKIHRSNINYWIDNKKFPFIDTICKLADYFGCSIDYLIGRSDKQ